MARSRNIKPGLFANEVLAECDPLARILFTGLWTLADREGRLEDRPKRIKAELLPYDVCDCEDLLGQLAIRNFIVRYEAGGSRFIQVANFAKHQNPHIKEAASTIPAPDEPGAKPVLARLIPDSSPLIPDSSAPDGATRARKQPPVQRVNLDDMTVDHIADWLARKRGDGKYVHHDEHFVLEQFRDYCKSKGKTYEDYIAAYRNAFEWERCQPRSPGRHPTSSSRAEIDNRDPATRARDIGEEINRKRRERWAAEDAAKLGGLATAGES